MSANGDKSRILHLMTAPSAGGAETNLLALLRHFDRERYEHWIAYGGSGVLEQEWEAAGARLLRLSHRPLNLKSMPWRLAGMVRQMRRIEPDLIHAHLDLPNLVGLAYRFRHGSRLVLHLHGQGIVPKDQLVGKRSYTQLLHNIFAHAYPSSDRAIAISQSQRPLLKALGFTESQIALIPNGIEGGDHPVAGQAPADRFHFIAVGRFSLEKNHDQLIRAFAEVSRRLPETRLTLVGDGPLRPAIETLVREQGLSGRVDFLGLRRDIPQLLANSHCFVLNSLWELHPITILEAMRAGLPVIASAVGGVPDTVADPLTGLLVPPRDQAALTAAMVRIAGNPAASRLMGEAGRIRVAERFSCQAAARRIESVYAATLEQPA